MVFSSVYEIINPLTTARKTHMWDWFDGGEVNDPRWTTQNISGSNTFQMSDVINGGFEFITGTTSGNGGSMNYGGATNDPVHFSPCGYVVIAVTQAATATNRSLIVGLSDSDRTGSADDMVIVEDDTGDTFMQLDTSDGTSISVAATCQSHTANDRIDKIIGNCCVVSLSICNTCACVCKSNNLPNTGMAPIVRFLSRSSGAKTLRIKYYEAYNS